MEMFERCQTFKPLNGFKGVRMRLGWRGGGGVEGPIE